MPHPCHPQTLGERLTCLMLCGKLLVPTTTFHGRSPAPALPHLTSRRQPAPFINIHILMACITLYCTGTTWS